MNTNEQLSFAGNVALVLRDKNGEIKTKREIHNIVVTAGLTFIVSRMIGTSKAVMSHMGLGSGNTAAAAGNTALESQIGARKTLGSISTTATSVIYSATFDAGEATGAITEAGIFNSAASGDMLCRTVFNVVNKAADDTLVITWTINLSAA